MVQQVMGGQLRCMQFPPLSAVPPEYLPDPWKPGSTNQEFNNGVHPDLSGIHGYYSATGRVATTGPEKEIRFATGFMITSQIALTAAHVIAPELTWKTRILFQPAFNGRPLLNFEKLTVRAAFIPADYFEVNDTGKDYAILVLDKAVPTDILYRLSKLNPGANLNIPSFAIGYPNSPHQQAKNGNVIWSTPLQVGHSIQTINGFSGSAIAAHQPSTGTDFVVGIHNNQGKASIVSDAMLAEINFVRNNLTNAHLNLFS